MQKAIRRIDRHRLTELSRYMQTQPAYLIAPLGVRAPSSICISAGEQDIADALVKYCGIDGEVARELVSADKSETQRLADALVDAFGVGRSKSSYKGVDTIMGKDRETPPSSKDERIMKSVDKYISDLEAGYQNALAAIERMKAYREREDSEKKRFVLTGAVWACLNIGCSCSVNSVTGYVDKCDRCKILQDIQNDNVDVDI